MPAEVSWWPPLIFEILDAVATGKVQAGDSISGHWQVKIWQRIKALSKNV